MKILLMIFLIFLSDKLFSQSITFKFSCDVVNFDTKQKEECVDIDIMINEKVIHTASSQSNGKNSIVSDCLIGDTIYIVFSKVGFVSKKIEIITKNIDTEGIKNVVLPLSLSIQIFTIRPNLDFSLLKTEPVARMKWNTELMSFDIDMVSLKAMKAKIDSLLNSSQEKIVSPTQSK